MCKQAGRIVMVVIILAAVMLPSYGQFGLLLTVHSMPVIHHLIHVAPQIHLVMHIVMPHLTLIRWEHHLIHLNHLHHLMHLRHLAHLKS